MSVAVRPAVVLGVMALSAGCAGQPGDPEVKCQLGRTQAYVTARHCDAMGGFVLPGPGADARPSLRARERGVYHRGSVRV